MGYSNPGAGGGRILEQCRTQGHCRHGCQLTRLTTEAEAEWTGHRLLCPEGRKKEEGEWKEIWSKAEVKEALLRQQGGHQPMGFRQAEGRMCLHTNLKVEGQWVMKPFLFLLCHLLDRVGDHGIFMECWWELGRGREELSVPGCCQGQEKDIANRTWAQLPLQTTQVPGHSPAQLSWAPFKLRYRKGDGVCWD